MAKLQMHPGKFSDLCGMLMLPIPASCHSASLEERELYLSLPGTFSFLHKVCSGAVICVLTVPPWNLNEDKYTPHVDTSRDNKDSEEG